MKTTNRIKLLILSGLLMTFVFAAVVAAQSSFEAENQKWRQQREEKLKADDGWLAVAGLFWLKDGVNSVGTSADCRFVLRAGSAPPKVGEFEFLDSKTIFRAAPGVNVTVNDQPTREIELKSDADGKPDTLKIAALSFTIIKRGGRFGVRLKDLNTPTRRNFAGLNWYAPNENWRVTAKFTAYEQPKEVSIVNILGDVEKMKSPGYVVFTRNGQDYNLEPVLSENKLFFIFRDLTSGKTTYTPGRFLYAETPKDGQVVLDFNQAINPPCAFTAFATCPLPTKRNYLQLAVDAGEKVYRGATSNHDVAAKTSVRTKRK